MADYIPDGVVYSRAHIFDESLDKVIAYRDGVVKLVHESARPTARESLVWDAAGNINFPANVPPNGGLYVLNFPLNDPTNNLFGLSVATLINPNGPRRDNVMKLGYNMRPVGFTPQVAGDASAAWVIESHFQPDPSKQTIEIYNEINSPNGLLSMRPIGAYYNKVNNLLQSVYNSDEYVWEDKTGSNAVTPWVTLNSAAFLATVKGAFFLGANESAESFVVAGTTKGVRIGTAPTGSQIEGVDNTGSASFQPMSIGASVLSFHTNGNVIETITSTGRVGIGTNDPQVLLHVFGSNTATNFFVEGKVSGASDGAGDFFTLKSGTSLGLGDINAKINRIGNIITLTSGSGTKLTGPGSGQVLLRLSSGSEGGVDGATSNVMRVTDGDDLHWEKLFLEASGFEFHTVGNTVLSVTQDGKVGIGPNAPTNLLHTFMSSGDNLTTFQSGTHGLSFYINNVFGGNIYWTTGLPLKFGPSTDGIAITGFAPKMTILHTGEVGIGTESPAAKLTVNGGGLGLYTPVATDAIFIDHSGVETWRFRTSTANTSTLIIGNDSGGSFANHAITISDGGVIGFGHEFIGTANGGDVILRHQAVLRSIVLAGTSVVPLVGFGNLGADKMFIGPGPGFDIQIFAQGISSGGSNVGTITTGVADSGGAGFRLLRVPN